MTTDELAQLLDTTQKSCQTIKSLINTDFDENLISLLSSVDDVTLSLILPLMKGMTIDRLKVNVANSIQLLQTLEMLVANGEIDKISNLCGNLKNRKVVLGILSKFV